MKRIYYLLAFIAVAAAFSACNPLDKTYKNLGDIPKPVAPSTTVNLTLTASDYGLLPSTDYAKTGLSYKSKADASASIPTILASKYPTYGDKSVANVTYGVSPTTIKLTDSLNADVAYTLTAADYTLLPGNTFLDFSAAQILTWLPYKYPTPAANELHVLTYTYFESGKTNGTTATDAFLYLNGVWTKIYRISDAQYTSVGNGVNKWFIAADAGSLVSYFNAFLKADASVMATAKFGDVKYVNYRYLTTYQRVLPLTFDGTNWVTTPTLLTLAFIKNNGVWVADNTVYYLLVAADYKYMGNNTTAGSAGGRANIVSFPDFNISSPTDATYWSDTDIQGALITLLISKYPTAATNQRFVLTYTQYSFGATTNVVKTFQYNGTAFVFVP